MITVMSVIGGVLGGLFVIAFIAAIGGVHIRTPSSPPECTQYMCESLRHESCGAGHCAHHCNMYCVPIGEDRPACIDPRPVPTGSPGHRPTVIKGGKAS